MKSRLLLVVSALATVASLAVPSSAEGETREAVYTGGGTLVVKEAGRDAAADEGVLVCNTSSSSGVGGGCVAFGQPFTSAVLVTDNVSGREVAFQVCIDNNGDGACVSPDFSPCADQIFFSHSDEGFFANPLGPLPWEFKQGCPGGAWRGYVVFLCEGVHNVNGVSHSHPATTGSILTASAQGGTPFGNFCGGSRQDPSSKRYVVL